MLQDQSKGLILGGIGVASFALTLPATRELVAYMDPLFIGLGRALAAAIIAALLLIGTRQPWPSTSQLLRLCLVSVGVVISFPILSAKAMQTLEASHGGVVLAILPLATAVISRLVSNERPSLNFWLLGMLGAGLVIVYTATHGSNTGFFSFDQADLLLFFAVISAAVGYAVGGKLASELGGWQVICWALVLAQPVLLYPTLCLIDVLPGSDSVLISPAGIAAFRSLPTTALLCFVYLSLVSQLIGFFFWYRGLALGGTARVSQLQLLQPFITIAVSVWLLDEMVPSSTWWFAAAVVAVVALSRQTKIIKIAP